MPVSMDGKVKTEIPQTTYQYTATPFMNSSREYSGLGLDAAACTNEYGVSMSMSVTAFPNEDALKADPLIKEGLTEFTANDLVVCQSKTAREGVEVLVFGNEFTLEYLSDYDDNITSKDLTGLAEKKGFAVHGKNGEINLFNTYSGKQVTSEYSHTRTWVGHKLLAPSNFTKGYNHDEMYPLCFTPDKNVSLQDVSQIMRNRYNGTVFSPDETGRIDMGVIGTDTALSTHIIQVFPNLPAEMSCVSWVSSGPAVYGVFVPISNDCVNVSEAYGANQPANETGVLDTDTYPYYTFKDLNTRCVGPNNYKIYGKPVQDYWYKAESNMFAGMSKVLAQAAKINDNNTRANYITSYCNDMQNQAFKDAKQLLNDVGWAQSVNSNTFKIKRNPETHQMTGEKVITSPMEVNLNESAYSYVPAAPN